MNSEEWNRELDKKLRQLAIEAQQHPPDSRKREMALTRLLYLIQKSGRLYRPHSGRFIGFSQEIHDENCNRVLLSFCQNIENYDSSQGEVLQYINFLLKVRVSNAIEYILGFYLSRNLFPIEGLSEPNCNSLLDEVIYWVKTDPDGFFKSTHIRHHPEANFQVIFLLRLEYRWREIEDYFKENFQIEISTSTLSSFYESCLDKFAPILKKYVQDHNGC